MFSVSQLPACELWFLSLYNCSHWQVTPTCIYFMQFFKKLTVVSVYVFPGLFLQWISPLSPQLSKTVLWPILWLQVQSLQNWKNEVLHSQTFVTQEVKREHECNSYNSSLEIQNTLARAEMLNKMGESTASHGMNTQSTMDTNKQLVLERTCAKLESQVNSLQLIT